MPKKTFQFKCDGEEVQRGTAYFSVEASSEKEARKMLAEDSAEWFIDFTEDDGNTHWDAKNPDDWERI